MSCTRKTKFTILIAVVTRIVLGVTFLVLEKYVEPFQRVILPDELKTYTYPKQDDTVEVWVVLLIALLLPLLCFSISIFIYQTELKSFIQAGKNSSEPQIQKSFYRTWFIWGDFIDLLLSYSLCLTLNGVATDFIKVLYGRPRPDFFNRCFPSVDIYDNSAVATKIASIATGRLDFACEPQPDEYILRNGRMSFVSGHSSFAFAAGVYVSFYIWGNSKAFQIGGFGESWRFLLGLPSLFFSFYVMISRRSDNRHHSEDVVWGAVLGTVIAIVSYLIYYPKLTCKFSHFSHRQMEWLIDDKRSVDSDVELADGQQKVLKRRTILKQHLEKF